MSSPAHSPADQPLLSIVLPAHNEAHAAPELVRRIHAAIDDVAPNHEVIVVDDGSTDAMYDQLQALRAADPRLRLIRFARNFGKEAALTCGIAAARGRAVASMDCDLQHSPHLLRDMLAEWEKGAMIVMALRQNRDTDSPLRRVLTRVYYAMLRRLSEMDFPHGLCDYNLYDRKVVEALKRMPERTRYMKGIVNWVGYKRAYVPMYMGQRHDKRSRFSILKLTRFALVGITAFSNTPLKIWSAIGVMISLVAIAYGGYLVLRTLVYGVDVPGYASLMVALLLLGGIQLISLGVIGEYLGRVFTEVKARPLYLIADTEGFEDDKRPG